MCVKCSNREQCNLHLRIARLTLTNTAAKYVYLCMVNLSFTFYPSHSLSHSIPLFFNSPLSSIPLYLFTLALSFPLSFTLCLSLSLSIPLYLSHFHSLSFSLMLSLFHSTNLSILLSIAHCHSISFSLLCCLSLACSLSSTCIYVTSCIT